MKKWLTPLAANRRTATRDRTYLKEFNDPLAHMDADSIKRLRNKCIKIALVYTLTGAVLIVLLIWASGGGSEARHNGPLGGGLMGAGMLVAALFSYGVFRLCTIRRTMIHDRRHEIAIQTIRHNTT